RSATGGMSPTSTECALCASGLAVNRRLTRLSIAKRGRVNESPLRICHLGKYYPPAPGGMEAHVQTLARAQVECGARIQVFCVHHHPGPTRVERDGGVIVLRFRRLAAAAKIDLCPSLLARLAEVKADLLHVHVPNPTMILAVLLTKPQVPIVVTYHSDYVRQRIRAALFRPLESRVYCKADRILATSPSYIGGSAFLQSQSDRLLILPHGIDARPFLEPSLEDRQEASRIRRQYQGPLWLACGRLAYYKGLVHAVRALAKVRGTLLIVGDGPERTGLETEVQGLRLER